MYLIPMITGNVEYGAVDPFEITHFRTEDYKPKTYGRLIFLDDIGFELTMWCYESNPRAIYHNPNDPVHTDSCMEGFINFYPELPELGYLSVEMNANGASHCSFGTGRHTRSFVVNRNLPHPEITVCKKQLDGQDVWQVNTVISLYLLEQLYGTCSFEDGHKLKANFYKCGNHTKQPHWGSWKPVIRRDFHSPDCFGELIMKRG